MWFEEKVRNLHKSELKVSEFKAVRSSPEISREKAKGVGSTGMAFYNVILIISNGYILIVKENLLSLIAYLLHMTLELSFAKVVLLEVNLSHDCPDYQMVSSVNVSIDL